MKNFSQNLISSINQSTNAIGDLTLKSTRQVLSHSKRNTTILLVSVSLFLNTRKNKIAEFIPSTEVLPLDSGNEVLDSFYFDGIKLFVKNNYLPKTLDGQLGLSRANDCFNLVHTGLNYNHLFYSAFFYDEFGFNEQKREIKTDFPFLLKMTEFMIKFR